MSKDPLGVLVMAYGSAPSLREEDIRRYLTHILQYYRKTDPSREELEDLKRRYQAVGGSPLYPITEEIVRSLEQKSQERLGRPCRVHLAMKHSPPFIEEVAAQMADEGIAEAVALALAPFRSRLSTDGYYKLIRQSASKGERATRWLYAGDWHLQSEFLDLWQSLIDEALSSRESAPFVIFTNHSLPARIRNWNDPYPEQFEATAKALSLRCGLQEWTTAYQSPGGGNQPWLGPDLLEVMDQIPSPERRECLVVPIGFLMDHLEILYDLDIVARNHAEGLGLGFSRTCMPNTNPLLVDALCQRVQTASAQPDPVAASRRS